MKKTRIAASLLAAAMMFASAPAVLPEICVQASAASSSKLAAPDRFKAAAVTAGTIKLTWKEVSGADAYRIYLYNEKKNVFKTYKTVTKTSHTLENLNANTVYRFKIAALVKKNGKYYAQETSSMLTVRTAPHDEGTPYVVQNLRATATITDIVLNWNEQSTADAYRVYRYNPETWEFDVVGDTTQTTYSFSELHSDTEYKFRVSALKKAVVGYDEFEAAEISVTTNKLKMNVYPKEYVEPAPGMNYEAVLEKSGIANYTVSEYTGNGVKETQYTGTVLFNGSPSTVTFRFNKDGECTGFSGRLSSDRAHFEEVVKRIKAEFGSLAKKYTDEDGLECCMVIQGLANLCLNIVYYEKEVVPYFVFDRVYIEYLR